MSAIPKPTGINLPIPDTDLQKKQVKDVLEILKQQIYQNDEIEQIRILIVKGNKIDIMITFVTFFSFGCLIGSIIYNAYHLRQLHKQNKKTDETLALIVDNTTTTTKQ